MIILKKPAPTCWWGRSCSRNNSVVFDPNELNEIVGRNTEFEHQADFIVQEVTNLLPGTLITSVDPDDIQKMVLSVDDALNEVHAVSQRLVIYQVNDIKKNTACSPDR